MRRTAHILLLTLTCTSVVAALATAAVWVRSIWVAEWVGWETLEATPRGGQRHANTAIGTFAGGVMFFRQMNDGPPTFTNPIDSGLQWYKEPNPTAVLRDLWFRFSFTHYSLPPKPGEYSLPPRSGKMIGDRGYTLELGVPDWAIIVVFLALPGWQFWRYRRSRHRRRRGFDPTRASDDKGEKTEVSECHSVSREPLVLPRMSASDKEKTDGPDKGKRTFLEMRPTNQSGRKL